MSKLLSILQILTAIIAVSLLVLLAWHCVDIYQQGTVAVATESSFTYAEAADRLKPLQIPFFFLILLSVITGVMNRHDNARKYVTNSREAHKAACVRTALSNEKCSILRWTVLIAGVVLVLWGVFNGSLYDVLVKSINICTECIGLG